MEYTAQSIRFLHVAYALMALGQAAYVGFLVRRWSQLSDSRERAHNTDD